MSNMKTSRIGSIIAFSLSAIFIALAGWLFLNRQAALDQVAVWAYTPTANIQTIEERVDFTQKGNFILYATHPSVESPDGFNNKCPRQETASPILGCYTADDRVYIYDITNEQLDGMEEVTAVHEMLHAVWARTSEADRKELEVNLKAAYEKRGDDELKERMAYYERTEPGELVNELHSILGTEVESLGEPLESYYGELFNRESVLKLHQKYNAVYKQLYERSDVLYREMQVLGKEIQSRSSQYDADVRQLSADINSFNARANNGTFQSQAQFNAERNELIRRSNALDAERDAINGMINTYNEYYEEYQAISKQIEVLNDSVDSFKQIEQAPSV